MTAADPQRPGGPQTPTRFSDMAGQGIVRLNAVGTAALVLATGLASFWESSATDLVNLVVSGVLFLGGCVAFTMGFLSAVGRSRTEVVDLAGLFYLTGSAPRVARRSMLGLLFLQIAVAAASVIAVRPPFGVMAPVWGFGLLAVWGARHGSFPARPLLDGPGRRSAPQ